MSHSSQEDVHQVNFEDNIDIGKIARSDSEESGSVSNASESEEELYRTQEDNFGNPNPSNLNAQESRQEQMRKKLDLLTQLNWYGQNGHIVQKLTIHSSLQDLEFEVHRVKKLSQIQNNVDVYKDLLVSGVAGIEMVNRFSPKKLALDGWSKNFQNGTIHKCEPYLHQIAQEDGQLMDPRFMLMITVLGSGVQFHFSQAMATALGNGLGNSLGEDIMSKLADNPEMLQNLLGGDKKGKKMSGPSFDLESENASVISDSIDSSDDDDIPPPPTTPKPKRKYVRKQKTGEITV